MSPDETAGCVASVAINVDDDDEYDDDNKSGSVNAGDDNEDVMMKAFEFLCTHCIESACK